MTSLNQLLPVDVRARGTIQISTTKARRARRYTKDFISHEPIGAHRSRAGTFVRLRVLSAFVVEMSFLLSRATRPPYAPSLPVEKALWNRLRHPPARIRTTGSARVATPAPNQACGSEGVTCSRRSSASTQAFVNAYTCLQELPASKASSRHLS